MPLVEECRDGNVAILGGELGIINRCANSMAVADVECGHDVQLDVAFCRRAHGRSTGLWHEAR